MNGKYSSSADLPEPSDEISIATSMKDGIWLKLTGVPEQFGGTLLRADLYRRMDKGWSTTRWATADRLVAGDRRIWQQTLSLTTPRDSQRASRFRRTHYLPPGEYLMRIYVDRRGKLEDDPLAELGDEDFVGKTAVDSDWPRRYGNMTVVRFPKR